MTPGKNVTMQETKGQVILYKNHLEVRLEQDTVWLDAHLIAKIFDVGRTVIVKHIGNIYKTSELSEKTTCAKIAQVAADGKTRQMNIYSLDVILSVGYRINSKRATQFRIWATNVLSKHLVEGYTLNEKRLTAQRDMVSIRHNIVGRSPRLRRKNHQSSIHYLRFTIYHTLSTIHHFHHHFPLQCS